MSSKQSNENIQQQSPLPKHIAIIMDGNGRWAKKRGMPRVAGHRSGVKSLRNIVEYASNKNIQALTVYAFSSENWQRPKQEVTLLMELFLSSLKQEIHNLHQNNIRLRFIGNKTEFPEKLQKYIKDSEELTVNNTGLHFNIAANYGGHWDIKQAVVNLFHKIQSNEISIEDISEDSITEFIELSDLPNPDLFIRTGGEKRISNYLLWQIAYTELYFTDCLWPDFDIKEFEQAIEWYQGRERRYGKTSEQVVRTSGA